jgi:D-beta-D-heptose 7-phosphate kinase/D-beta-D-heptose 1-phosphate adenosyltransferase
METRDVAGGAANVALNLASLGADTCLIGVVGNDDNGRKLTQLLDDALLAHELVVGPSLPTTTKTRIVADGQCLLRLDEERLHSSMGELVWKRSLDHADDIIVVSDYNKGAVCCAREIIAAHTGRVLVDPKRSFDNYFGAWLVKPNRREFEQFVGEFQDWDGLVERARESMAEHEIENMLVTLGADGMILVTQDGYSHVPSLAQEVFDITGAGDVVIAVVAYAVSQGKSLARAVEMANLAAARAVAHHGNYVVKPSDLERGIRVFTNGCFDILHPGHISYLEASRALGDHLTVAINSDDSVRRLKGSDRPINSQEHRRQMLMSLRCVDDVVIFNDDTPANIIRRLDPDIITKGGDYTVEQVVGHDMGPQVVILPHTGDSTTEMIQRIRHDQA